MASYPLPTREPSWTQPLRPEERRAGLDGYLAFLEARDGDADFASASLARREAFFDAVAAAPVRWKGSLDRDAFHRNLQRAPRVALDEKILWLLAAAKSNVSERYAVELILQSGELREGYGDHSERMFLEEVYHTRILYEACRCFDLEFEIADPPAVMRVFIRALESASDRVNLPLSYCGELIGVVLFDLLREKTHLFHAQPEVEERLSRLCEEILVDEFGHLTFCLWKLSPTGLTIARTLLPAIALATLAHVPEFSRLAGGRGALLRRILRFEPSNPAPRLRALLDRASE